jgi:solute carrier family 25, member 39/40
LSLITSLVRNEGVLALWSGLPPTLVMSVPATVLYFAAYDSFRDRLLSRMPWTIDHPVFTSVAAGASARVLAATAVSPLELARTQMQSSQAASQEGMLRRLRHTHSTTGLSSLWRGLVPTLLRDVPFSAIYWPGYELLKRSLTERYAVDEHSALGRGAVALTAGATAGMLAAMLTTPFDVVKTRHQVAVYSQTSSSPPSFTSSSPSSSPPSSASASTGRAVQLPSVRAALAEIVRVDGSRGLMVGMWPRMARIAPSCAIMITSYELAKDYFAR